jgi:TldD protein
VLDQDLASEILVAALSKGGGWAEIFVEERSSTSVRLDDGKIEELSSGLDRGAGVRVGFGGRFGYAFSNRLDRQALLEVAEAAAASVPDAEPSTSVTDLRALEPAVIHLAAEPADGVAKTKKVDWLREADEEARGTSPDVKQVTASYADSVQRVLIATSDGRWLQEERPRIRLVVQVVAARDDIIQTGFYGPAGLQGAEYIREHPPKIIAGRAATQAVAMLDSIAAPAGEMAVVMAPGTGGVLFHEACGHGLESDLIQKEASIYRGRLGDSLASPLVTGVDDATIQNAWGSFSFDDEGAPAQRTVLFEGGDLRAYMYDRIRSQQDGVESTGNGRRQSYAHPPIPRMTNSYILAGEERPEELVSETSEGFYAKSLGGGQVNPATGDFVFGVTEGYMIEKGEMTKAVRGANLVGRGIDILTAIDMLADDFQTWEGVCGKDGQGVPVGSGSPTLRISRMTVGGTG